MREICKSGAEGGATQANETFLLLSAISADGAGPLSSRIPCRILPHRTNQHPPTSHLGIIPGCHNSGRDIRIKSNENDST